jgi:hypothetical protein
MHEMVNDGDGGHPDTDMYGSCRHSDFFLFDALAGGWHGDDLDLQVKTAMRYSRLTHTGLRL